MPITFNQAYYKKILDIIAVIRSEGQYVFSCKSQSNECWINFCGMDLCFVNHTATRLKSRDLDIMISVPMIANDNNEEITVSQSICPVVSLNFIAGSADILASWHKEIVAFRQGAFGQGAFDMTPVTA